MMAFRPGASLVWKSRDTQGFSTMRPVTFRGLRGGGQTAVVTFGQGDHQVPVDELSLPGPRQAEWWIPPRIEQPPPPTPPTPPTEQQINERIAEGRAALRTAFEKAATAAELVATALKVADRARQQRDDARMALARARAAEREAADEFEQAIRKGDQPPALHKNGFDKAGLEQQCVLAEQTFDRFTKELSVANSALAERLTDVRRAAEGVVAAILEKEAENLRRLEAEAARYRAALRAASATIDAKLSPAAATLLEAVPNYTTPSASSLIVSWQDLIARLIDGDDSADLKLEEHE
jgi:hypothetical protein